MRLTTCMVEVQPRTQADCSGLGTRLFLPWHFTFVRLFFHQTCSHFRHLKFNDLTRVDVDKDDL